MKKREQETRFMVFLGLTVLIFASLSLRLFYLQILQTQQFRQQSESNRTRLISIPAQRGEILDKNGKVLATSMPVFAIDFSPPEDSDISELSTKLADVLDDPEITPETIIEDLKNRPEKYAPVQVASIPWGEKAWGTVSRIEENRADLPGVSIEAQPLRYYPNGQLAGHILGYVGKINEEELEENSQYQYNLQDWIGKTGIERFAELLSYKNGESVGLRGTDGVKQVEVNASNQRIEDLMTIPPSPGDNVVLTIDVDLQKALEQSMDQVIADAQKANPKAGAAGAIVLDVKTGAILAAASRPAINPNDFADGSYSQKADYYNNPQTRPMFNRVFQGTYPPGSTFKPITGIAALEAGVVKPTDTVTCTGAYWNPPYIKDWSVHGVVDLYKALGQSCNVYFQEMGRRAGIEAIAKTAEEFGLGQKTDTLGILNEAKGIVPSPEWKKETMQPIIDQRYENKRTALKEKYDGLLAQAGTAKEKEQIQRDYENKQKLLEAQYKIDLNFYTTWQSFDTYNTSIGQGSNSVTVIQLARYVAAIANGGKLFRPYLVDKVVSPQGEVLQKYGPQLQENIPVSADTLADIRKGMKAVAEPGGTGYFLFYDFPKEIGIGAKSGTAQTGRAGDNKDKDFHGVFIAFAPFDDPQIAFASIVEYGDSGGGTSGRIARAVFQQYFGLNSENPNG